MIILTYLKSDLITFRIKERLQIASSFYVYNAIMIFFKTIATILYFLNFEIFS